MEQKLTQTQSQKMMLSPLILQYLRLLQQPVTELRNTIEQELAENPALEETSKENPEEPAASRLTDERTDNGSRNEELRFDETLKSLAKLDDSFYEGLYSQEDFSIPEAQRSRRKKDYQESLITRKESLFDFLLWQIGFIELSESEQRIAEEIVGNITTDGYLNIPLEEIAKACGASQEEVERVLSKIHGLDPPGIAARNLQETLLLQLQRNGPDAELACRVVREYLPLLEKKQWEQITKNTKASPEETRRAAGLIARLDPKPGRSFYSEDPIAVTPDANVYYDDDGGKFAVEIYDEGIPDVRVSSYYRRMLKQEKLDEASRRFLKEKIQSALDFVKALGQRRSTLARVTEEIVSAQPEFFEKGFSHLKPLRLKDISARLGIHESTVSRAIQGKYLSTPQGTLPYKSFFSSRLERVEGEAESQKSMMERIKEMIRNENPASPLSDEAITKLLQQEGFKIARRTVAKYRELSKILPTHLRRTR